MKANKSCSSLESSKFEALLKWVDSFELSRSKKKLNRDFSDGVLLAEILKMEFPSLVDLHNYNGCFAVQEKIRNWKTLNQKVLKKLQITLKPEEIEKIAKAESNCIEEVLFRIMNKIQVIKRNDDDKTEADIPETSSVMMIKSWKQVGDKLEQVSQQMIEYSMYQELHDMNEKQQLKIDELKEINEGLLEALEQKSQMIADLQNRIKNRKNISIASMKNSIGSLF